MDTKRYLDLLGLQKYDELIKKYIADNEGLTEADLAQIEAAVTSEANRAKQAEGELLAAITSLDSTAEEKINALAARVTVNEDTLAELNGDGENSITSRINAAVAALVDGAPEALDTLKEIANWITNDEDGAATLAAKVTENANAIADLQKDSTDLKAYVDAKDEEVYASIMSIEEAKIIALFRDKVAVESVADLATAIAEAGENDMLVLPAEQVIASDIVIDKDVYIDANGSIFTGEVKVAKGKDVIIENAVFFNPVVVE